MLQIPDINTKDARDTGKAVSRKELRPGVRVSGPANPKRVTHAITHAIHIDSIPRKNYTYRRCSYSPLQTTEKLDHVTGLFATIHGNNARNSTAGACPILLQGNMSIGVYHGKSGRTPDVSLWHDIKSRKYDKSLGEQFYYICPHLASNRDG